MTHPAEAQPEETPNADFTESDTCDTCGWVNLVLRKRCRNCGADLVQHPDPAVDREVRLDAEDGRRYERPTETREPEETP